MFWRWARSPPSSRTGSLTLSGGPRCRCSSGTAGASHGHPRPRDRRWRRGRDDRFSFIASRELPAIRTGTPRFVDIEEETLGLDPRLVASISGDRVRGSCRYTSSAGRAEIEELSAIASQHGWSMIEYACEALGSTDCRSTYWQLWRCERLRVLRQQARSRPGGRYRRDRLGRTCRHNAKPPEPGARSRCDMAAPRSPRLQLPARRDVGGGRRRPARAASTSCAAARERVVAGYAAALGDRDWLTLPSTPPGRSVDWFVYVVRLDPSIDRNEVMKRLDSAGVASRPYFTPLHLQPFYREQFGYRPGDFAGHRTRRPQPRWPFPSRHGSRRMTSPMSPMSLIAAASAGETLTCRTVASSRATRPDAV